MYPLSRFVLLGALLTPCQALLAQTCQSDYPGTTPTERFTIQNDTVYDTQTGLTWKRCYQGLSGTDCNQGTALEFTWEQALQTAEAEAGWRLPNIKELQSIVERQCYSPALNTQVFPGDTAFNVWSSSPNAGKTGGAWFVYFYTGTAYGDGRNNAWQVRLVRSGQ